MFKVIILICALGIPPSLCDEKKATQILESAEFHNELGCQQNAQPLIAKLAIKPLPENEYMKMVCPRSKHG